MYLSKYSCQKEISKSTIRFCPPLFILTGCLYVLSFCSFATAEQTHSRWAIIATPEAQQAGVPDLLTVALSDKPGIELVERDQIDLALGELELNAMFSSEGAAARLQLGKLLKADAMILLSAVEVKNSNAGAPRAARGFPPEQNQPAKNYALKVVICESHQGMRLLTMQIPLTPETIDAVSTQVSEVAVETQTRLQEGIRHVFAVTPFLAKGLRQEHDHLQTAFRSIVEQGLLSFPGVAVLEMEEAMAIDRELRLGGKQLKDRIVPLVVEGEYEVLDQNGQDEPVLNISAQVRDGEKIRSRAARNALSLSDTTELLGINLPHALMRMVDNKVTQKLDPQQQLQAFVKRAQKFDELGAWSQSIPLREAALLIDPKNLQVRAGLISNYRQLASMELALYYTVRSFKTDEEKAASLDRRFDYWKRAQDHAVECVLHRLVNPAEARKLYSPGRNIDIWQFKRSMPNDGEAYYQYLYDSMRRVLPVMKMLDPTLRDGMIDQVVERCSIADAWLRYHGISSSSKTGESPERQYQTWAADGLDEYVNVSGTLRYIRYGNAEDNAALKAENYTFLMDETYWYLTEVADPDHLITMLSTNILPAKIYEPQDPQALRWLRFDLAHAEVLNSFFQRLLKSGGKANRFYAEAGLLNLEILLSEDDRFHLRWIKEANEQLEFVHGDGKLIVDGNEQPHFESALLSLRRMAANHALSDLPEDERDGKTHVLPEDVTYPLLPHPRMSVKLVEGVEQDWRDLISCGPDLDIAWSNFEVFAITAPGQFRKIYGSGLYVESLAWDGKYIWIWDVRKVVIIRPTGEIVATVGPDEGFPVTPATANATALWFYPLEPGRCLAVSTYGTNKRVFCAEIAPVDNRRDEFRARVIYSATKRLENADWRDPVLDLDVIFDPAGIIPYAESPNKEPESLLIGRDRFGRWEILPPVSIDLKTLKPSFAPFRMPISTSRFGYSDLYTVGNQVIKNIGYVGLEVTTAQEGIGRIYSGLINPQGYKKIKPSGGIETMAPDQLGTKYRKDWGLAFRGMGKPSYARFFLDTGDKVYSTGRYWYAFDKENLTKADRINESYLPAHQSFSNYAISSHYGVLGWNRKYEQNPRALYTESNRSLLFTVKVDSDEVEDPSIPWLYVPETQRPAHLRAVKAILDAGGKISPVLENYEPRTGIFLGEDWRGGEAELSSLKDLYKLTFVHAVKATVGRAGLKEIAKSPDLDELMLVETDLTDEDLVELRHSQSLRSLRLEGTFGGKEFSDAGLTHVANLSGLTHLWLYGSAITDQGMDQLAALHNLRELELHSTEVSPAGMKEVMLANKGLKYKKDGMSKFRSSLPLSAPKLISEIVGSNPPVEPLDTEKDAVLKLRERGATFQQNSTGNVVAVTLDGNELNEQDVTALQALPGLEKLLLNVAQINDQTVQLLQGLKNLREIYFAAGKMTDQALTQLAGFPQLKFLHLVGQDFTLETWQRCMEQYPEVEFYPPRHDEEAVEELELLGVSIGRNKDDAVVSISGLKQEKIDQQLELISRLPHLKVFFISNLDISEEDLQPIFANMKKVEKLNIDHKPFSGTLLKSIPNKQNLTYLNLKETGFSDIGMQCLTDFPKMENLYLSDTDISDEGIAHLAEMKDLRVLYIGNTKITDESVKVIASLKELIALGVDETAVSDASIPLLEKLTKLRILRITKSAITDSGYQHLQKALPDTKVINN